MKLYNNMIDLLADVKDRDREIRFIDGEHDETVLTFSGLWEEALALLGSLQQRGMKPGDELIIFKQIQQELRDRFLGGHSGRHCAGAGGRRYQ
jgi:hypothetical protein